MAKITKLRVHPRPDTGPARQPETPNDELYRLGMEFASGKSDSDQAEYESCFPGDPERAARLGPRYKDIVFRIIGAAGELEDDAPLFFEALRDFIERQAPKRGRAKTPLPKRAPTLWKDRDPAADTNPAMFTRTLYARWLGHGLTRQHLRDLDADLYRALSVWEHRHPEDRITELPTLAEVIDARIAALADEFSPDELRKLGSTLQTRHRRSKI
jgi:hypothetical protein